jgi:hypothetical protein
MIQKIILGSRNKKTADTDRYFWQVYNVNQQKKNGQIGYRSQSARDAEF